MDSKSIKSLIILLVVFLVAIVLLNNLDIKVLFSNTSGNPSAPSNDRFNCKISDQVIYDADGIKITTNGFNKNGIWGPEIKVIAENYTSKNLCLAGYDYVVNGVTVAGTALINVNAGTTTAGSIFLLKEDLQVAGITDIATVFAYSFTAYEENSTTVHCTVPFYIRTNIADTHIQQPPSHTDILYEQYGITVSTYGIVDGLAGGLQGQSVVLMITNNSSKDVFISTDNVSANGFTVDGYFGEPVYKDTVRFFRVDIRDSYLKDCGIERIESAKMFLRIVDVSADKTLAETGELQIHIQN